MFSLFRQRGPRGFDPATRFYDPEKEARAERLRRSGGNSVLREDARDREAFARQIRHSWQRKHGSGGGQVQRLVLSIGMVSVILYFIIKAFGLVRF
jgi:hypothetical protein